MSHSGSRNRFNIAIEKSMLLVVIVAASAVASSASAQERHTAFKPDVHGFEFSNTFTNDRYIAGVHLSFGGRCGGMSYAALDYFHAKTPIPNRTSLPTEGSALSTYISGRQEKSTVDNIDRWAELIFNPFGWRTTEFFNWGIQGFGGGRLQELRSAIDKGQPAPLGLFSAGNGGAGPHHQVVAIGYSMGRYKGDLKGNIDDLRIFIYDPNYPGVEKVLRPDSRAKRYRYEGGKEDWLTYFVDGKYAKQTPGSQAVMERCSEIKIPGQNKSGQNLSSNQNRQTSFRCADLRKTNFKGSTLTQVDFYKADLTGAIFYGANLRNSRLVQAKGPGADFYGADLKTAQFHMSDFSGGRFYGADLKNANLDFTYLRRANFQGADLYTASLQNAGLENANFSRASLKAAKLNGSIMRGANLRSANLDGTDLSGADLRGADLTDAVITPATKLDRIKKDQTTKGL